MASKKLYKMDHIVSRMFFFFQAEDGIRDHCVTGVQTCALPISHAGRGGWSWYTGSAGWMYRAGLESILGLRRRGSTFEMDPCIPSSWPHYAIDWRYGRTLYTIAVSNPERRCRGIAEAELDGATVDPLSIPLV